MKKYGKSVTILAVLFAVLALAGSAFAYGGRHHGPRGDNPPQGAMGPGGNWEMHGFGDRGPGGHFGRDLFAKMPQDIRDKMAESQKIGVDLRMELSKPGSSIDKNKAIELYRKQKALRDEVSEWCFMQRLEMIMNPPAPAAVPTPAPTNQ